MDLDEFCRRVENLRQDRAIGPKKPYKPLLLAALLVLIAKRKITTLGLIRSRRQVVYAAC